MQEVFEKIKERLEEVQFSAEVEELILAETNVTELVEAQVVLLGDALEIVNQVAEEYNQSLTNADKIRSMTDEELAVFYSDKHTVIIVILGRNADSLMQMIVRACF